MRKFLPLLLTVAVCAVPAGMPRAADQARLPSMVLLDWRAADAAPSALPRIPDFAPRLPGRAGRTEVPGIRDAIRAPKGNDRSKPAREDDDDEDDETSVPTRPGTLSTAFPKYPTPIPQLRKSGSFGPHLRPDVEFDLTDRTTVGLVSQLDRFRPSAFGSVLGRYQPMVMPSRSSSPHPARGRDVGLGATFEFKLGQ